MMHESISHRRSRRVIRDGMIDGIQTHFDRGERAAVQMLDGLIGIDMAFASGHID